MTPSAQLLPRFNVQTDTPEAVTFQINGTFDGASAWELRNALDEVSQVPAQQLVLDFSRVRDFYDFGVAVLAHGLVERGAARPKVALKGLRTHQMRLFRYFGVDAEN